MTTFNTYKNLVIKTLRKKGAEVNSLSLIKSTYKKPANIIILYGERLKVCPLPSEPSKDQALIILFSIALEILANVIMKENKRKDKYQKGRNKIASFCVENFLHRKSQRIYKKQTPRT